MRRLLNAGYDNFVDSEEGYEIDVIMNRIHRLKITGIKNFIIS